MGGRFVVLAGLVCAAKLAQGERELQVGVAEARIEAQRRPKTGYGLIKTARGREGATMVVMHRG